MRQPNPRNYDTEQEYMEAYDDYIAYREHKADEEYDQWKEDKLERDRDERSK